MNYLITSSAAATFDHHEALQPAQFFSPRKANVRFRYTMITGIYTMLVPIP